MNRKHPNFLQLPDFQHQSYEVNYNALTSKQFTIYIYICIRPNIFNCVLNLSIRTFKVRYYKGRLTNVNTHSMPLMKWLI
jgi:hypothetical protein